MLISYLFGQLKTGLTNFHKLAYEVVACGDLIQIYYLADTNILQLLVLYPTYHTIHSLKSLDGELNRKCRHLGRDNSLISCLLPI